MSNEVDPPSEAVGLGCRSRWQLGFALVVAVVGLMIGIRYYGSLWALDANGLSRASSKLPYWDFTNLWAGARMAAAGHVDRLFDAEAYRAALRQMFTPLLPDQEWSYPPSILLVGLPLSVLPIFWAYLLWTMGTILALHLALRPLHFPPLTQIFVVFSPAVMLSALFGQNGAFTAALMFAALALAAERPVLAGLFAGLLSVKPHLGILIPFAYLASGNWRAFVSAAATAGIMVAVTALMFGPGVWPDFIHKTGPLMASILEAPYPQTYHVNAMTFFILGRWLGLPVAGAYACQAVFALLATGVTIWLWRRESRASRETRIVLTALMSICATPYGYTYDAVPYSIAVAWFFLTGRSPVSLIFAALWLFPYFADLPNAHGYGVSVLAPAGLTVYGVLQVMTSRRRAVLIAA